jgi:Short C-terminal domain
MQQLTSDAERAIANLSERYRVSQDAVRTLLFAVSNGGGGMAQFSHPELGGSGQWMRGGMTMVGDMFNYGLQGTVSGICSELSNLLASTQVFLPLPSRMSSGQQQQQYNGFGSFGGYGGNWWPADLGSPSSSGGQNGSSYAYFPQARRLAVQSNGQISVYDTLDHQIGGVQQQQGGPSGSQSFSSQFGTFTVESLPLVSGNGGGGNNGGNWSNNPPPVENPIPQQPSYVQPPAQNYGNGSSAEAQGDVIATLERLGALRDKGILSDQEFQAKKADLLSRL